MAGQFWPDWQAWELRNRRKQREEEALLDRALAEWVGSDSDDPMTEDEEDPALALACSRVADLDERARARVSAWDEAPIDGVFPAEPCVASKSLRSLRLCVRSEGSNREDVLAIGTIASRRVAETAEEELPRPSVKTLPKAAPARPHFMSLGRWDAIKVSACVGENN